MTAASPGAGLRRTIRYASAAGVVANASSAFAGLLAARYLGPAIKGQYAAVSAWFAGLLILGELGQQSAVVYYVARDPTRAPDYVTTARNIMIVTGATAALVGILLAPGLAHGRAGEVLAYRVLFSSAPIVFIGGSFRFALQACSIGRWMVTQTAQSIIYLVLTVATILSHRLTLDTAVGVAVVSFVCQGAIAWYCCGQVGLLRGRHDWRLGRSELGYGVSQLLASTPTAVNTTLDQMFLSQSVASAGLGQYALAASLTGLANPLLSPIGSVLFPRLASGRETVEGSRRLQRYALLTTAAVAAVLMGCLSAVVMPIIPVVFGRGYRPSIELVWIMAPAGALFAFNNVAGDLLRGRGRPLSVALSQGVGAVLTVILLVILVPLIGVRGAAITTTASYAVTSLVLLLSLRLSKRAV